MIIAENPTLPSENIENQTVPTSVMHSTANITEPIGQNTINLEVNINEAVTKFLSYLIFYTHDLLVFALLTWTLLFTGWKWQKVTGNKQGSVWA